MPDGGSEKGRAALGFAAGHRRLQGLPDARHWVQVVLLVVVCKVCLSLQSVT
jgi:hypothetical protein